MLGVPLIPRAAGAALLVAFAALMACATPARAAGLETVLQDDAQLLHRPEAQLRRSLEEMRVLGVDRIRVTAGWSVLTRDADSRQKPHFDAADPRAYEQDRWRNLDRLLVLAREYGFKTMIDIAFWAPHWASTDPPGERGRSEVDAREFARFAVAVARRYNGRFVVQRPAAGSRGPLPVRSSDQAFLEQQFGSANPPDGPTSLHGIFGLALPTDPLGREDALLSTLGPDPTRPLPAVDVFTLWNEPNHSGFLRPQWQKGRSRWLPRSPHIYREMVHAAYPAIKQLRPEVKVLVGGTAAYGSYAGNGGGNVPPLRFIRELACVDANLRPIRRRSGCGHFQPIPGDGWSHHPYTMKTEPDAPPRPGHDDDVPLSRLGRMTRLIDALVKRGRLAAGTRELWITEYGYETNPPVAGWKYGPGDQARFLPWAEDLASRTPAVRTFAQFLLRDLPVGAFRVGRSQRRAFGQWQSGLLEDDGDPKLAVYSFRAGLHVEERARKRLRVFGRLRLGPGPRTVRLERRPPATDAWRVVPTRAAGEREAAAQFTVDGRDAFLRFGFSTRSLDWRYRLSYWDGDQWRVMPSITPVRR